MLIDFHTHIFPDKIAKSTIELLEKNSSDKAHTDGTVLGLIEAMEKSNADICVCQPVLTKPTQFESVAKFALSVNEQYENSKRKLISFAGIHPACDDIKGKMKFLKDNGFLGVKIHPDYQDTYIDDDGYIEILKCAKDNDLIVLTHAGIDGAYKNKPVKCPPVLAKKVIEKVNYNKFVLGHFGGLNMWDEVYNVLAGLNVYFDTACSFNQISEELFIKILDKHGENKVVFATDCPWRDIKTDKEIFTTYNLSKETKDKILYKNALKLLKME